MKKSKIIIPALALIAFSTIASVAGSVAWFTANRTATINAGSYAVVKTNANLEVALSNGIGTSTSGTTVTFNGLLTDGSVNHSTQKVYTPDANGTALAASPRGEIDLNGSYPLAGGETLADLLERGETNDSTPVKIYTAATFDITFTIKFGSAAGDFGLYLDNTAGKSNFAVDGGATAVTATGFRMAFLPKAVSTNGRATVFADLQSSAHCNYVASTSNVAGTSSVSSSNDLIDSGYNAALPGADTARATAIARPDYLGYFAFSANQPVNLSYTVVAWFEGTDPNVVNQDVVTNYQTVISTLCFEAVALKAAV